MLRKARKPRARSSLGPLFERVLHMRAKEAQEQTDRHKQPPRAARTGRGRPGGTPPGRGI